MFTRFAIAAALTGLISTDKHKRKSENTLRAPNRDHQKFGALSVLQKIW